MTTPSAYIKSFFLKKIATVVLLSASLAAFATLGGGGKKQKGADSILMPYSAKNFSLRSNYQYKSNQILKAPEKKDFIMLHSMVTFERGNAAYVLPLKKMPLSGKIKFQLK